MTGCSHRNIIVLVHPKVGGGRCSGFWEEGSVHPLGQNLIKQVSASNWLSRRLWGE